MAKLPNHENAYVSMEKLTGYCLNEQHPYGKEKAAVFKLALGIERANSVLLKEAILKGLADSTCFAREKDEYGARFTVVMKINNFEKEAEVTTGWIIRSGEDFPRLTSCYIKRRKS